MVIKITPKQSKRINALIRKLCCNYVDGNCLLLDDGEEHSCVQCISRYGIYCNYFKNAVLPADNALHAEIMRPAGRKQCQICKTYFIPKANNQRYCPDCATVQKRKKAAERQRRKRAVQSQAGFRVQPWRVILFCDGRSTNSLLAPIGRKFKKGMFCCLKRMKTECLCHAFGSRKAAEIKAFSEKKCGGNTVIPEHTKSRFKTVTERRWWSESIF